MITFLTNVVVRIQRANEQRKLSTFVGYPVEIVYHDDGPFGEQDESFDDVLDRIDDQYEAKFGSRALLAEHACPSCPRETCDGCSIAESIAHEVQSDQIDYQAPPWEILDE